MSVPNDAQRRAFIRTRLAEGTLPSCADDQRIYGGYGEEQACDCCGNSISSTDVLYEIAPPRDAERPLAMHLLCFDVWVQESRKEDRAKASATSGELGVAPLLAEVGRPGRG